MTNKIKISSLSIAFIGALSSMGAQAHGWVEYPSARQNTCYLDGGFWDNTIPNQACQAAYDESGAFPFVQRNEVAANVPNYKDMAHVQAIVRDGNLCSAGDNAKAGLNVGSSHWQKTAITLDENNQIELIFNATAPHNPSYWQFYLSNSNYDPTVPLTWGDLDLIDTAGNVPVGEDKKYRINITLPADRADSAVLYTRWQREDAAGEGFYNCSDISFDGTGTTPPGPTDPVDPPASYSDLGYYISQGFGPVESGDTVRFRTFDTTGAETTDISLAITVNNTATWSAELAGQFNQLKNKEWFIGIWHQEMNHYMYDTNNIYANRVFAPSADLSYQLSLIKADTTPPVEPPVEPSNAWQTGLIYNTGDVVSYNDKEWTAQWWTKGEEPGTTGEWGVWR
ncbi:MULTISPECIES: lytic polysaccharide monooxygenase [Aliivibrio]|uniref:Spindolin n=1 Tax=Aliivibrio finisterrensis TaxID=511998 RepID=A0A4Q5L0N4_9GAMM|nr:MULTISPECIES: lytic polysaccharide monooxygenase [Aliivibrio]MDD9178395.1 lytic polysaccharide monooxygenase [Aliivibrio sp. A6]RYU52358.1 Spindolin [Aliivibrio finisterrensis]RYU54960.1 Spindolin [Aliivibrio finisterrensis]RYU57994.1 Spindolin [Aliivibrio finisterrensis]RYU66586.1 Spindolin [Aliivibrio finisterrensis]